jgi:hypothetical protein
MILANARYYWNDGYPMLAVEVDGRMAEMGTDCKPSLHEAGIVFLGSEFADAVPPIEFPTGDGHTTTLRGFSRDETLFRLYDEFLQADEITPGPVAIPA